MRKVLSGVAVAVMLMFAAGALAGSAQAQAKSVRIVLSPSSTVPRSDVTRHFLQKCPSAVIVLDPHKSDFMLQAGGWSGDYRFTLFRKGGQAVFGTSTVMLSNAVKDVCRYVSVQGKS
ncbi:MAG: hypothetical protein WCD27_11125 [Candidatus Acidiferrales bacterium]